MTSITKHLAADDAVQAAALYVAAGRDTDQPVIADLKTRFGLTAREAVEAIRLANTMRGFGGSAT